MHVRFEDLWLIGCLSQMHIISHSKRVSHGFVYPGSFTSSAPPGGQAGRVAVRKGLRNEQVRVSDDRAEC